MVEKFSTAAAFIWSVADLLRVGFKQSQYGRGIILPFTLSHRLESVLELTKPRCWQNMASEGCELTISVTCGACCQQERIARHIQFLESMSPRENGRAE